MNQIEKPLRLLAALNLKNLRTAGGKELFGRFDAVNPAWCALNFISHNMSLDMRIRQRLRSRPSDDAYVRTSEIWRMPSKHARDSITKAKKYDSTSEIKRNKFSRTLAR